MQSPTKREGPGAPAASEAVGFEPTQGAVVAEKYRVERLLGEGGMGVVVAATHLGLDQKVAIKFLHASAMRNAEAVERFQREAKVAAKVSSEHIARVTDVGTVKGVPYIVMEYLEGVDLGDLIDREGKLPIDEACEIALQACEALAEVHGAGIVHRDLKPSNLFITRRADESPCLKLLDFGISKFTVHPDDSSADPALTQTATIMGSPSYMSPEQLKSTKEVDARTDVWSLGAVLYESLTGKPAFRGETVPQVCAMIASDDPPAPSTLRGGLPDELEKIVLACLDKKPERRATLLDLARVLVRYAPARARASLERIEATLGVSPEESRERSASEVIPVLSLASAKPAAHVARTQASWQGDQDPARGRRSGAGPLLVLVVLAGGLFAVGLFTGRIKVKGLKGDVASAASAMSSVVATASSAVASAASAAPPLPSELPMPDLDPALASAMPSALASALGLEPSASASAAPAASDEADEEEEDPVPSATASAAPALTAPSSPSAPHYVAPKKRTPKRRRRPRYPRHH